MTPEPSRDYLTSYAEREARERLQIHPAPFWLPASLIKSMVLDTFLPLQAGAGDPRALQGLPDVLRGARGP